MSTKNAAPKKKNDKSSGFREWAKSLTIGILAVLVFRGMVAQAYQIPSGSMEQTLLVGNLHATSSPDKRLPDVELLRAAVFVDGLALPGEPVLPLLRQALQILASEAEIAVKNALDVGREPRIAVPECPANFTRQLAVDYAGRIRVNCVCPGTVETPFVEGYLEKFHKHEKEKVRAELHARQPVGRMGRPDEIASLVLYLCSTEAEFVTGSAVTIDGGWTAT